MSVARHLTEGRHISVTAICRYFSYDHLPEPLKQISAPFTELVETMLDAIPNDSPELTAGLRKLLEAKDCMVRAALDRD